MIAARRMSPAIIFGLCLTELAFGARVDVDSRTNDTQSGSRATSSGFNDRRQSHVLYAKALLRFKNQDWDAATAGIEKAIQLMPNQAPLYRTLAACYLALGRPGDATTACTKATRLDGHDYNAWLFLAELEQAQGFEGLAVRALERAYGVPELRENTDAYFAVANRLGLAYQNRAAFARARRVLIALADLARGDEKTDVAATAYENLARLEIEARRPQAALGAYAKARDCWLNVNPARALQVDFQMAQLHLGAHRPERALECLTSYLCSQPAGAEPYELLIRTLQSAGRSEDILPRLARLRTDDKHNVTLGLIYARQLSAAGRFADSEKVYRELANETANAEIYAAWFRLDADTHRSGEAIAMLDHGCREAAGGRWPSAALTAMMAALRDKDLTARLLPAALAADRLDPVTKRFLAHSAMRCNQLPTAERLLRDCLESPGEEASEGSLYDGLLRVLWAQHKPDAIVDVCRRALENKRLTNQLIIHENLARALTTNGLTKEALAEADRAVALASADARVTLKLLRVEILRIADRLDQAETECLAILKEAQGSKAEHEVRLVLSGLYSSGQNYPEAEMQLRRILDDDPNDVSANNDLGYLLADRGIQLDQAEAMIQKAIRIDRENRLHEFDVPDDRDNAAFIDSLGWVHYRQGKFDISRCELEKAAALPGGSRDPVVADHLGEVYFRLRRWSDARRWWRQAIQEYETERSRRCGQAYDELRYKLELLNLEQPSNWL